MSKEVTASDSVRIDRELDKIPDIVEKYSSYFFSEDPKSELRKMRDEILEVFDFRFVDIND